MNIAISEVSPVLGSDNAIHKALYIVACQAQPALVNMVKQV